MKILLINKFHYQRGGSETYYFAQAEALVKKGHEVIFFAMKDEKNIPCEQEKYFAPNVDYNGKQGIKTKLFSAIKLFYSSDAKKQMELLIEKEQPDIAHIGLLHRQITFSVVDALKKHNIPVVMTMHDLIFACPNYTMTSNSKVCEDCLNGSVLNCIRKKCVKDSFFKSILGAGEKRYLEASKFYDRIDLYIAECEHYKQLMLKSKFTKSKIVKMTNFLPMNQEFWFDDCYENYILYFGRFSHEKGVLTLLRAHQALKCQYNMKVVGAGPSERDLKYYTEINSLTNIDFPGAIYGKEMEQLIEKARVIVVPSEWYENCPYALLQSIAKGKIVIASDTGGLSELIENGKTGFLFEAGNVMDLVSKINCVMKMEKMEYEKMSNAIAQKAYEEHYWEPYIDRLLQLYSSLISVYNSKAIKRV